MLTIMQAEGGSNRVALVVADRPSLIDTDIFLQWIWFHL